MRTPRPRPSHLRNLLHAFAFVESRARRDRWSAIEGLSISHAHAHTEVARTTAFRRPLDLLRYLLGSRKLIGKSFQEVVDRSVARPEVQALVDMITEGTCSAAPREIDASYMVRAFAEMWSPRTRLQYPKVRTMDCTPT